MALRSFNTSRNLSKIGIVTRLPVFAVCTSINPSRKSTSLHFRRHTSPMRIPVHAAATTSGYIVSLSRAQSKRRCVSRAVNGLWFTRALAISRLRITMSSKGLSLPLVAYLLNALRIRDICLVTVSHANAPLMWANHALTISGVTSLIVSHLAPFSMAHLLANVWNRSNHLRTAFRQLSLGV